MAFFKSKQEREIMAQMERDEQLQVFNDQIKELKAKSEEYDKLLGDLLEMRKVMNQIVFKGRWKIIKLLMK